MRLWTVHPKYLDAKGPVHEWQRLLGRLKRRAPDRFRQLLAVNRPVAHTLFRLAPGLVRERGHFPATGPQQKRPA
jgi:hypothetical protein